jgi:anti-sigma-K factor RskA
MSHEAYSDLAAAYALGALDGPERGRFETHLRDGCPPCQRAVIEYAQSVASLAAELAPVPPPPASKAALMARIRLGAPRST